MPKLPTLHVLAPFYSTLTPDWLHDGHTDRCYRFVRMMQSLGYPVVEYAVEGSQSDAETKVAVLAQAEHAKFFAPMSDKQTRPTDALGSPGWTAYNFKLTGELLLRVNAGDFVCHTYGESHRGVVALLPAAQHIETGIGYGSGPFGAWRIFDSEAWRHFHWGKYPEQGRGEDRGRSKVYSWVIPNPHDPDDWPIGTGQEDAVVYFGRMDEDKGMNTIREIIREHAKMVNEKIAAPLHFAFAGRGDFDQSIERGVRRAPNPVHKDNGVRISHRGPLPRPDVARFLGAARCIICPTQYIEPLGNVSIEALFTGTPALVSDFGGFTETIRHGIDGYRCRTLGDWLVAIEACRKLDRRAIAQGARERFSTDVIAQKYDEAFHQIMDLSGLGWYSRESHRIAGPRFTAEPLPLERQPESLGESPMPQSEVAPEV